jgi:hypothetical protein
MRYLQHQFPTHSVHKYFNFICRQAATPHGKT